MVSCRVLLLMVVASNFGHCIVKTDEDNLEDQVIDPGIYGPPKDFCILPTELGNSGRVKLLEDCDTMHMFNGTPPISVYWTKGSGVLICCPELQPPFDDVIVFPDQLEWGEDEGDDDHLLQYEDYLSEEEYEYVDYYGTLDDAVCDHHSTAECTEISKCDEQEFTKDFPPPTCGFDVITGEDKVCCKARAESGPGITRKLLPKKYGDYDCEDFSDYCKIFVKETPESCSADHPSFRFMRMACVRSCGRCGSLGCRDEFERCDKWKKNGGCIQYPDFMLYYCRESCGGCGFVSPRNNEVQVVKGKDYTDINSPDFFCGVGGRRTTEVDLGLESVNADVRRRRRSAEDHTDHKSDIFFYASETDKSTRGITCGSVIIADRFILMAAHCHDLFQTTNTAVRTAILRDGTVHQDAIEIRRVFVHPGFKYPILYNDIAVAELGRRIVYDHDVYGDSPGCISDGKDIEGRTAIVQGYGYTEDRTTSPVLLETNVTVIGNPECAKYLTGNTTNDLALKLRLKLALRNGVNDQLLCSTGIYVEDIGLFTGPCPGDSGGPLYVDRAEGEHSKTTLEGIVCGGLSCGGNVPSWYTRVSSYRPWISCIMEGTRKGLDPKLLELQCSSRSGDFEKNNEIE